MSPTLLQVPRDPPPINAQASHGEHLARQHRTGRGGAAPLHPGRLAVTEALVGASHSACNRARSQRVAGTPSRRSQLVWFSDRRFIAHLTPSTGVTGTACLRTAVKRLEAQRPRPPPPNARACRSGYIELAAGVKEGKLGSWRRCSFTAFRHSVSLEPTVSYLPI